MNPQQIKNYAFAAGAVVVAYALYKAVTGVRSFFEGPKQNPVLGTRAVLGKERTAKMDATDVLLLQGKITMAEAERRKYPERFRKAPKPNLLPVATKTMTDAHGPLTAKSIFAGIGAEPDDFFL